MAKLPVVDGDDTIKAFGKAHRPPGKKSRLLLLSFLNMLFLTVALLSKKKPTIWVGFTTGSAPVK